ncbi:MAG: hypothetical protein NC120_06090 [Ruminococcus sp.]|nr:hypothetical protein [Ruminococcus sp.]
MSVLTWDATGDRLYETGIKKGVLYPIDVATKTYNKGYAWNGLSSVSENPSGAESNAIYADDIKYLDLLSAEELGLTIEAYTRPDAFEQCDGSAELDTGISIGMQSRLSFGLCYRTALGNDVQGSDYAYKLHLIYGCKASPSERSYNTINDSPDAATMSWEVSTTPVEVKDHKPTSILTIDSSKVSKEAMKAIEDVLYGTNETEARLPLPEEVVKIMKDASSAVALQKE